MTRVGKLVYLAAIMSNASKKSASAPAAKPAAKSSTGFDDMDDDIPF